MIYECLVVPSESPNSLLEIKRALLTYDKVKLVDPSDRDIMPSNIFMSEIFGMPIGMSIGAVRPMGKVLGYDEIFEKITQNCKPAIEQGLIDVISTYNISSTQAFSLGGVQTTGYPLNTQFVFELYRRMSQDQQFLAQAISGSKKRLLENAELTEELVLEGVGDRGINNIPPLPLINDPTLSRDQQVRLTEIARARIASVIKYAGFCEMKDLVPVFDGSVYGNVVAQILNNAHTVLDKIEDDLYWIRRNRVLELCHEEFLDEKALSSMSIAQVIRLRSKAWGQQAKSREALFSSVGEIALDIDDESLFQGRAIECIRKYRKDSESLIQERKNLSFKIKCEMGKAMLIGGAASIGLLSQVSSPLSSMGVTLVAGGAWVFDKSKEYLPDLRQLKAEEAELKRGAGFGLHDFYSRIK